MESEATSPGPKDKVPSKNQNWSKKESEFLMKFLTEEAQNGNKPEKGFKTSSYNAAARAINEKFVKKFSSSHVLNHLKTLKKKWKIIQEIKSLSGATFNEDTYTVGLGEEEYQTYIETHPSHEPYINKPLLYYPHLEKICSTEVASGAFQTGLHATSSRSFNAPTAPSSPIEQINAFSATPEEVKEGASGIIVGAQSSSGGRRINNSGPTPSKKHKKMDDADEQLCT